MHFMRHWDQEAGEILLSDVLNGQNVIYERQKTIYFIGSWIKELAQAASPSWMNFTA